MKRLIFSLLIWSFSIGVSRAEVFYLKSGEVVRGSVVGQIGQKYKIKNAHITNPEDGSDLIASAFFVDKDEILKIEQDVPTQDEAPSSQAPDDARDAEEKTGQEIYEYQQNLLEHFDKTVLPEVEKIRKEGVKETNQEETGGD